GVSDAELQKELEKAIQSDQAAAKQQGQGAQQKPPAPPAATSTDATPQTLPRGTQSLNPDISAILDADFGYQRRAPQFQSGDDPNLGASGGRHALGFTAQEVELALSAIVDPYFRGDIFLTIPNLEGIEVEEAFATTTSLPWNLQIKAGSFRSAFGRQNGQHLHIQDFTRRPLINAAFLGADGLRGPGVQVSWLAPLPFFLTLYGEALSIREDAAVVQPGEIGAPAGSFGADGARRPVLATEAKAFFPFGDEWSLYGGLSFASGKSPGLALPQENVVVTAGARRESQLFGADLYVKWKPANVAQGYASLALQAEAIFRHFGAGDGLSDEWDGGAYAQAVMQVARRWFIGLRGDLIGIPASSVTARTERVGTSLTWQGSEFARVRLYFEAEHAGAGAGTALLPPVQPDWAPAAFLQLEFSLGAHGAHPF
ncbi:MAG TPA: hypothetical protein VFE90_04880, partial [Myxococcales bacterium]|nr:hypothetical protein [Myxococcales bacterium]